MSQFVIGVDLGGTQIRAALCDAAGKVLKRVSTLTRAWEGPGQVTARIEDCVRQVAEGVDRKRLLGIGLGAPGTVNPWTGVVSHVTNIPGLVDWPAKENLAALLRTRAFVGNDAKLAALGEHRFGAGKGADSIVYLTVSTGIGGGVIERGRLVLGARGWATELGHIVVEPEGPPCGCGGHGCLESLAAGPAIARQAREKIEAGARSALSEMVSGRLDQLSAKDVVTAARSGDAVAGEVMRRAAYYFGLGLVSIVTTFDPQKIVIGGGVSNAGELLLGPARAVLEKRAMTDEWRHMPIELAKLGEDVGLLGAAALVLAEVEGSTFGA